MKNEVTAALVSITAMGIIVVGSVGIDFVSVSSRLPDVGEREVLERAELVPKAAFPYKTATGEMGARVSTKRSA